MFHVTWKEAKEAGAKRYFSATPCSRGHTAGRLVSGRSCIVCHKDYQKTHYRKNNITYLEKHKRWRDANPGKTRIRSRKYNYGITEAQWEEIFDRQRRCCALCKSITPGSRRGWHTDHEYKSGVVRGILCLKCNLALGHYEKYILPISGQVQVYLENNRAL